MLCFVLALLASTEVVVSVLLSSAAEAPKLEFITQKRQGEKQKNSDKNEQSGRGTAIFEGVCSSIFIAFFFSSCLYHCATEALVPTQPQSSGLALLRMLYTGSIATSVHVKESQAVKIIQEPSTAMFLVTYCAVLVC